ncbi:MAG: response regulator [Treponema sp.]|jgi:putative two-component system response regulator|nr:response regulator [Treponema sp.]
MAHGKKVVLAIDDIVLSLHVIKKLLEDTFEVYLAKSIDLASNILNSIKVDMILLDIEMPEISGLDYLKYLQETPQYRDIPVIFITSHATKEFIVEAMNAGAKDFIAKPISPDILKGKICTVLKMTPERKAAAEEETVSPEQHLLDDFKFPF